MSLSAATDLEVQLSVDYQGRRGGGVIQQEALEEGRGEGEWEVGGVCVRLRLAIRQVGTQMAGRNKSIKANLPRLCNSFSIGGQYEEGGTVDMTHV